jgi:hypothetical protein
MQSSNYPVTMIQHMKIYNKDNGLPKQIKTQISSGTYYVSLWKYTE